MEVVYPCCCGLDVHNEPCWKRCSPERARQAARIASFHMDQFPSAATWLLELVCVPGALRTPGND
jgi:hypothetical protein